MSMFSLGLLLLSHTLQAQIAIGVDDLMPDKIAVQIDRPKPVGEPLIMNHSDQGYIIIAASALIRRVEIAPVGGRPVMNAAGGSRQVLIRTESLRSGMFVARVAWEGGYHEVFFEIRR